MTCFLKALLFLQSLCIAHQHLPGSSHESLSLRSSSPVCPAVSCGVLVILQRVVTRVSLQNSTSALVIVTVGAARPHGSNGIRYFPLKWSDPILYVTWFSVFMPFAAVCSLTSFKGPHSSPLSEQNVTCVSICLNPGFFLCFFRILVASNGSVL